LINKTPLKHQLLLTKTHRCPMSNQAQSFHKWKANSLLLCCMYYTHRYKYVQDSCIWTL